jgi:hypothetical protein
LNGDGSECGITVDAKIAGATASPTIDFSPEIRFAPPAGIVPATEPAVTEYISTELSPKKNESQFAGAKLNRRTLTN